MIWQPWIRDCIRLLDGDGAFAHFMYAGGLADQPAFDMHIYDIIRRIWVTKKNAEMKPDG